MSSDLMTIATSGAKAARAALDVTAQNIANASTEGYVRRSVQLAEIAPPSVRGQLGSAALSGVRLDRVERNVDLFKMAEMRRTTSDLSRANAQLSGLEDIEASLENAQIYPGMLEFEASLEALAADPTNLSLRASALESARTLARSFNVASTSLDAAGHSAQFDAAAEVDQVNVYANELARINLRLARAQNGSTDQSALLDQRDLMLQRMSALADVAVTTGPDFTVEVRLGSGGGIPIVQGGVASALTSTAAPDGTPLFAVDGLPVTLAGGSLAGHGQALAALRDHRSQLDTIAANLVAAVNTIQTGGAALDGAPGQPFFTLSLIHI
jgi:flagellar hook-associated protein 1 FlgK